jgi:tripartite-type tricarboxylate transporter receptor subunit TctC
MTRRSILSGLVALGLTLSMSMSVSARAQDAAAFYKGKTVHFVVGLGVGGGFDAYARMIAPYLGQELGANVVVDNLPGAGGLLALNQIYTGQADGLRLLIVNGTPAGLGQLIEQDNIRYDLAKFDHLGIISAYPWIWVASKQSGLKSIADALQPGRKIRWGGTGPSDGPADGAAISCEALKLDCQTILGYRSSGEIALAMERGELDSLYISDSSAANYTKAGQVNPVASMARVRSALLPDVPTVYEQAKLTPDQEWWFDFRANLNDLGRILVTSPGTPPERLAFLREAVRRALTNPALIAEGEKSQRFVAYQAPEKAVEITRKVLTAVTPEQKKRIREAVFGR